MKSERSEQIKKYSVNVQRKRIEGYNVKRSITIIRSKTKTTEKKNKAQKK